MATRLESAAALKSHAVESRLTEAVVDLLMYVGVSSFGRPFFSTNYQLGQSDKKPLISALSQTTGRAPTNAESIGLRSLSFKSSTLAVNEFRQCPERDETAGPAKMQVAQRNACLESQCKRLQGVHFIPEAETSHRRVDTVCQVGTEQTLEWTFLERLTSRGSEIANPQKDLILHGPPKRCQSLAKSPKPYANIKGDVRVRRAFHSGHAPVEIGLPNPMVKADGCPAVQKGPNQTNFASVVFHSCWRCFKPNHTVHVITPDK